MIEAFSTPSTSPPPLPSSPSVTAAQPPPHPHPLHPSPLAPNFPRQHLRARVIVTRQLSPCHFSLLSFLHLSHFLPQIHIYFGISALHESSTCSRPPHPPGGFSNFLSVLHSPSPLLFIPMSIHLSSLEPSHVRHPPSPLLSPSLVFPGASFHSSVPLILPLLSANLTHFTWLESFPSYQSISSPTSPILISYSKSLHLSVEMSIL